jgi:hypothetical protein
MFKDHHYLDANINKSIKMLYWRVGRPNCRFGSAHYLVERLKRLAWS